MEFSSNTWVGASSPYVKTKTSVDTGDAVVRLPYNFTCHFLRLILSPLQSVMYGSGGFNGSLPFSLHPCLFI